ncbi:MAG: GTPase Der [Rhodomicrobium sp.]|nr:MAG: GTPase Der [Rhodomicrobium sp.]
MSFTVAIMGRPNVGKSTLFNRLAGRRLALVDPRPGMTRDRREAEIQFGDVKATLVDTAGLEEGDDTSIQGRMRQQTKHAVADADIILFMIDARDGVTVQDEVFAALARETNKPVQLIANKCEGRSGDAGFYDGFSLGLGQPIALSAEHGEGVSELYTVISEAHDKWLTLKEAGASDEEESLEKALKVAIVGRPNAGKSTLLNRLIGEERVITGPEAGLTRDSISVDFEYGGRALKLFDTAGLRKKARIKQRSEKISVSDALRAVRFAEVVVLLLDAERPLEKQDMTICDLVAEEGRALVIAVNKYDLAKDQHGFIAAVRERVERLLPQIRGVPVVPISALRGKGVDKLMKAVFDVEATWNRRVSTSKLNNFLRDATEQHTPPAVSGRRIRLRYMTQPNARPPTFVVFCSRPEVLPTSYTRYLINGIRETFDIWGVPVRLFMRKGDNPYDKKD